ncbi:solute carrier family 22 member 6-B-like isoform X4 [Lepidochelys kempii]|uniref:solute carrier family 22 member 6-B-like isoform X4 n=1 Tax=Lepidochelys kempii TaxID=8472 RepID=UPI003C6F7E27
MAPGVQLEKEQCMGFFQIILIALVFLPLLMVASHNFLQNFTAAVPRHWCYIPVGDNDTTEVTGDLLKIYVPMDDNQEPDRCLRFSTPQWQLLAPNGTSTNTTEPCLDGWAYDRSVFNSTIITEAGAPGTAALVPAAGGCDGHRRCLRPQPGSLLCLPLLQWHGYRGLHPQQHQPEWIPESARWLIVNHRPEMALRNLRRVAWINGEKLEGEGISLETLRLEMQQKKESLGPSRHSALGLFRTAPMRGVTCCLMLAWFSNSFSYYHLALDLQRFGDISIFLVQLIFGAVDVPFRMLVAVAANRLGRRLTQAACLFLGGLFILASIPVPQDMEVLLIALTVLGKGLFSSSSSCSYLYTTELYPTVIRQTGLGVTNMMARLGAVAAPMVQMTQAFVSFLPLLLFGAVPITAGILVNCLPETLGVPLADTMMQVEDRARKKRSKKEELKTKF